MSSELLARHQVIAMVEPSEHFSEAFGSGIGSPMLECNCGRTHYAPDSEFIEQSEADEMIAASKAKPDRVIVHQGDDGVSAAVINGATMVRGCPCGWLAKFEDYIWNERERILRYYKLRREADARALAGMDQL